MEDELQELLTLEGLVEAEIIKSKLESFNIPVLIQFETAARIFGISMDGLGKVKIKVPKRFIAEAREIIKI